VQAGFGIRQLEKADAFGLRRKVIAERFNAHLAKTPWLRTPVVSPKAVPSWLALPVMVHEEAPFTRAEITSYLESSGIETRPVVTGNVARHPVAKLFPEFSTRPFPGADKIHTHGFYIGLSPLQTDANVDRLLETFDTFLARY
jgi:CDP-6-deoxy-D-xylo-4-hexulose-3-dehydrase